MRKEKIDAKIQELQADIDSIADTLVDKDRNAAGNLKLIILRLGVIRKEIEGISQ